MVVHSRDGLPPEAYKHDEVRHSVAPHIANATTVLSLHRNVRVLQDITGTPSTLSMVQCHHYRRWQYLSTKSVKLGSNIARWERRMRQNGLKSQ